MTTQHTLRRLADLLDHIGEPCTYVSVSNHPPMGAVVTLTFKTDEEVNRAAAAMNATASPTAYNGSHWRSANLTLDWCQLSLIGPHLPDPTASLTAAVAGLTEEAEAIAAELEAK